MNKRHVPEGMAAPFGRYSHGVEVPPQARWLHVSGQVGVMPDGRMADGIEGQSEWAWRNLQSVLAAAGMDMGDVVKITTYITHPSYVSAFRDARDGFIGDHQPASTLVVIESLADPDWLIEIELVAARA